MTDFSEQDFLISSKDADYIKSLRLFHGSSCEIRSPSIEKSLCRQCFGKGFFTVSSSFVASYYTTRALKVLPGRATINEYRLKSTDGLKVLWIKRESADADLIINEISRELEPSEPETVFSVKADILIYDNMNRRNKTLIFLTAEALERLEFIGAKRLLLNGFFAKVFWSVVFPLNKTRLITRLRAVLNK